MTKRDITSQVRRLAVLGPMPSTEEAIEVLIEVLRSRCTDIDHVKRAVNWCCDALSAVPKPVELVEACEQTYQSAPKAKQDCPICCGSGFETIFELHTHRHISEKIWVERELIRDQPGKSAWWIAHSLTTACQERRQRGEHIRQYVIEAARRCHCRQSMT